ncbi:FN1 [Branchiostoma lanceolatum]|uniref:FN1 protein n=1 Tax=Branchiostoma lanceolatum TaxID=7740 RepID=A0A8K0F3N5_BRALA|nr:FN1 [Branchiostoma lanceolatum]
MKIKLLILAFLAGTACAKPLKAVEEPEETNGDAQTAGGHGRTSGLGRLTENPDVGPGPGFENWMEDGVTLQVVEGSLNTDKVPYGPLRGPEEPANRNVRAVSEVDPRWLNGLERRVVGFFPNKYQAPPWNAVDCSPDTMWIPKSGIKVVNRKHWIIVDMQGRYRVYRIRVVQGGNRPNDIKDFVLEMSSVHPYVWEVVIRSDAIMVGTTEPQHFGDFDMTSQYWKITMRSTSGWPVKIRDFCFFGHKEMISPQSLTCSAATCNSFGISWIKPSAPLIGYRVNYTLLGNSPLDVITNDIGPVNEEHVLRDAQADQEYIVTLVAVGIYKKSSPLTVTCLTLTPPPEDFQMTYTTETSVTVAWKRRTNSLAIYHRIWISRSDTADSLLTQLVPTGQTDLAFTDLTPGTEYVLSATSFNRQNEGPAVHLTVATKTDSPMALEVEQKTTNTITISWVPPKAVLIAYNITYAENGRSTPIMTPGDADSCELTDLVPGTQYDIDLVAVSRVGKSIAIGISVVTDTDPPSSLRVTKSSTTWMFLEWTPAVANILYYDVDISDEYGGEGTLMSTINREIDEASTYPRNIESR